MRKYNFFAVLLATAVVVGSIGCKKENENSLVNQHKAIIEGDALGGDQLRDLEFYTPEESTVNDKLLLFAKYMNEPAAYPMPNMEIREAIWFSETFFNLGLVYNQERSIKEVTSEVTDFIDVPFEGTWGENVVLNGTVFQLKYRELLKKIKARLSSDYVINFGDVYVKSVNVDAKIVTLGVRHKKGGELILNEASVPYLVTGPLKIVSANHVNTVYPYSTNVNDKFPYLINVMSQEDVGMVATLNQERALPGFYPNNIQQVDKWAPFDPNQPSLFYVSPAYETVNWGGIHYMYVADYNQWGNVYQNYIWHTLWPSIYWSWYDFVPYWAGCTLNYGRMSNPNSGLNWGKVYHQYGIETVCQFTTAPPCKVRFN